MSDGRASPGAPKTSEPFQKWLQSQGEAVDEDEKEPECGECDESEENPRDLPLWLAVHRVRTEWKGLAGTLYWHPKHGFQVVGVNKNSRVGCQRACIQCDKATRELTEALCPKCGGKREVQKQCEIFDADTDKQCTNTSNHNDNGVHVCNKHFVAADPKVRGCLQCQVEPKSHSRADGLCKGCVKSNKHAATIAEQRIALEELMAQEGIAEWPGAENAAYRTRYATLNRMNGYRPHVVLRSGNQLQAVKACEERGCCNFAHSNPDTGERRLCRQHGGGLRCRGPREGVSCPLGHAIAERTAKRSIWYEGMCVRCFCEANPNEPRAINAKKWFKARENEVVQVLKAAFPDRYWTLDKGFAKGVLQRPDMRLNGRHRIVLVEIDEDSHRSYDCGKEREREAVFFANAAIGTVIVMLRFNPDAYTDYSGVRHPSCFIFNSDIGTWIVNPAERGQWTARCNELVAAVRNYLDPKTYVPPPQDDRVIFSHELFYDDISGAPEGEAERARAKKRKLGKQRARQTAKAVAASAAASAASSASSAGSSSSSTLPVPDSSSSSSDDDLD